MRRGLKSLRTLAVVGGILLLTLGCLAQNPSKFPYFLPFGESIQTHAKPPGKGYFANFDPYACRLEVRPKEASIGVGQSQVLIATIYDASGQPRRARRVEWMLEGKGHIIEVDESGYHAGRGAKINNQYGYSYTSYFEHLIDRGNSNPTDDFIIRPGQTWCVISSPIEGDTQVTVYAPEIFDWDKHKVIVQTHWVNAGWIFPPPATCRGGSVCYLTTNVYRLSDKQPLAGYRVRYTVLDGPPCFIAGTQDRVGEVATDFLGNAKIGFKQQGAQAGVNRIGIEVIRPPDPTALGPGIILGRGESSIEWTAPALAFKKSGPPTAAIGQTVVYTLTITNNGRVDSEPLTVYESLPDGMSFVGSSPQANRDGAQLVWTIAPVPAGQSASIQVSLRADRLGSITNVASVRSPDGLTAEDSLTTVVAAPGLSLTKTGPQTALVGEPINYVITATNTGNGPATNIIIRDQFDAGLAHASGTGPLDLAPFNLAAGESRTFDLSLTAQREGVFVNRASASADGGLTANAEHPVTVTQPKLKLAVTAPKAKYVRSRVEWTISVANPNSTPLNNVNVRSQLPSEVSYLDASDGGRPEGSAIVWSFPTLAPGEEKKLRVAGRADRVTARAINRVSVTAAPSIDDLAEAAVELRGAPALLVEMVDTKDPITVGERTSYDIRVSNTGTLVTGGIQLVAIVPPEMQFIKATGPGGSVAEVQGNRLIFPVQDGLIPENALSYTITLEGVKAGDPRLRIELKSNLSPDLIVEEEPTTVLPK